MGINWLVPVEGVAGRMKPQVPGRRGMALGNVAKTEGRSAEVSMRSVLGNRLLQTLVVIGLRADSQGGCVPRCRVGLGNRPTPKESE